MAEEHNHSRGDRGRGRGGSRPGGFRSGGRRSSGFHKGGSHSGGYRSGGYRSEGHRSGNFHNHDSEGGEERRSEGRNGQRPFRGRGHDRFERDNRGYRHDRHDGHGGFRRDSDRDRHGRRQDGDRPRRDFHANGNGGYGHRDRDNNRGRSGYGYQRHDRDRDRSQGFHGDHRRDDDRRFDRRQDERSGGDRPWNNRSRDDRPRHDRSHGDRPYGNRSYGDRSRDDRRQGGYRGDRSRGDRYQGQHGRDDRRRNDHRHDDRRGSYQRDRQNGYDRARRNSDGTISYPSQNPYTDRRPGEPKMPKGLEWSMLSKDDRLRLRGLSKEHAENIGLHILAAYALEETDPQGALAHAKWAARQASRIDLARETLALVAYRQGDYKLALKEFRTAHRMNGYSDYLPFIADCERGLGNPRKAIEEATSEEGSQLQGESKAEMFLVYAGALGDLGLWDKAIETVQALVKARGLSGDYRMRAVQAEQNFLEQAGRSQEALELEPLLDRLEAEYADEDEDEDGQKDGQSEEILIDYDLEHLDPAMMEDLSIDSDGGEDDSDEAEAETETETEAAESDVTDESVQSADDSKVEESPESVASNDSASSTDTVDSTDSTESADSSLMSESGMQESSDAVKQSEGEPSRIDVEASGDGSQSDQTGNETDVTVADEPAADGGDLSDQDAGSKADTADHQNEESKDEQVKGSDTSDEAKAES
ncbi:helicase [Bifidobacterium polysaccharolyticum]